MTLKFFANPVESDQGIACSWQLAQAGFDIGLGSLSCQARDISAG
jgi:hypothetical protein